ncbi:hypothetical protein NDU88_006791 [Pleurodeles waltl]|uniref:Uncharacterized protein n=1 Tax=Pleurodeles waltl TaxID=8319 RepID=A0AAV7NT14_PLEWA|nr:hypothetical protein NDU88_006791 [Pleurodeles waltl]
MRKQAPPLLERGGERLNKILEEGTLGGAPNMAAPSDSAQHRAMSLEERPLGGARKMAAPTFNVEDTVSISSEEEVEEQGGQIGVDYNKEGTSESVFIYKEGKMIPWVPRVVSPMLHKVQAREVDNQAVFKVGEQVEFLDRSGLVLRGTICGEASGDGKAGRPPVMLDFWQPGQDEGLAGCDSPHVLGGNGDHAVHQQVRRLAGVQSLPSVDPVFDVRPSTSRGTGSNLEHIEEELLDYDEEVETPVASVPKGCVKETPRVVQSDHRRGRRQELVIGNLQRGCVGGPDRACSLWIVGHSFIKAFWSAIGFGWGKYQD